MNDTEHNPSIHKPTCPEFDQQPNAENDGFVIDTAFPCNCGAYACAICGEPGEPMQVQLVSDGPGYSPQPKRMTARCKVHRNNGNYPLTAQEKDALGL